MRSCLFFLSLIFSLTAMAEPSTSTEQDNLPVFISMAHCNLESEGLDTGRLAFDIYVKLDAINPIPWKKIPGTIGMVGMPTAKMKMLYSKARISLSTLEIQPVKLRAVVGIKEEGIIIKADLFELNGSFTGNGIVQLGAKGEAPIKCTAFPQNDLLNKMKEVLAASKN